MAWDNEQGGKEHSKTGRLHLEFVTGTLRLQRQRKEFSFSRCLLKLLRYSALSDLIISLLTLVISLNLCVCQSPLNWVTLLLQANLSISPVESLLGWPIHLLPLKRSHFLGLRPVCKSLNVVHLYVSR